MTDFPSDTIRDVAEMKELMETISSQLTYLQCKVDYLLNDDRRREEVVLATKTLDKFDDYMKNVEKLNAMINEFKGCVSLARGALEERKKFSQEGKIS